METWRAFSKELARPSRGLVAARRLRRSSVLVFGLGGIGSTVCEILVRTGVGSATIWDVDRLVRDGATLHAVPWARVGTRQATAGKGEESLRAYCNGSVADQVGES